MVDTTVEIAADDPEELVHEYVGEMATHEAFSGPIRLMPDVHPEVNSRTLVGFTMPFNGKAVPSVIGSDLGCGVTSWHIGPRSDLRFGRETMDARIREAVPMGIGVYNNGEYHLKNDFPWDELHNKFHRLKQTMGEHGIDLTLDDHTPNGQYDIEYVKELSERVQISLNDVIGGIGSLGAGNHFIEFGADSDDDTWVTVHSGSRGIGGSVADYWMDQAHDLRSDEADRVRNHFVEFPKEHFTQDYDQLTDDELLSWVQGGWGEDFVDIDQIKADYLDTDPHRIESEHQAMKDVLPINTEGHPWDYLDGQEMTGYLVDMLFAQHYAATNRREILRLTCDAIEATKTDEIHSPHNYIDYDDAIIRKGATPAREGERGVVPMNMGYGVLWIEGTGATEWNDSAPHGAGRPRSRSDSFDMLDTDEFMTEMADLDVYSSSIGQNTLDESPSAYKDPEGIVTNIAPMATVVDRFVPFLSIKGQPADWRVAL